MGALPPNPQDTIPIQPSCKALSSIGKFLCVGENLKIQERDIGILKYIYEQGYATSEHIYIKFWLKNLEEYRLLFRNIPEQKLSQSDVDKIKLYRNLIKKVKPIAKVALAKKIKEMQGIGSTNIQRKQRTKIALNRLIKLDKMGVIKGYQNPYSWQSYLLTSLGYQLIRLDYNSDLQYQKTFLLADFDHSNRLNYLRSILEMRNKIVLYKSDRILQSQFSKSENKVICDAEFELKNGKIIGIEVENRVKSEIDRYTKKFSDFKYRKSNGSLNYVYYFCKTDSQVNKLQKYIDDFGISDFCIVTNYDKFLVNWSVK